MTDGLDLNDSDAWDDSALIKSWNDALAEYKKYHSIHAQGKRLEDVLTDEELAELMRERSPNSNCQDAEDANIDDTEIGTYDEAGETEAADVTGNYASHEPKQHSSTMNPPTSTSAPQGSVPHVLMNGIQDEGLKNLMMSWYYAGYYTGLCDGQQKGKEGKLNIDGNV